MSVEILIGIDIVIFKSNIKLTLKSDRTNTDNLTKDHVKLSNKELSLSLHHAWMRVSITECKKGN